MSVIHICFSPRSEDEAFPTSGTLYSWGDFGTPLGRSIVSNNNTFPVAVSSVFIPSQWDRVFAGVGASFAISNGELWSWGTDELIGRSGVSNQVPRRVGTGSNWSLVATGQLHSIGIAGDQLYAWGYNNDGQLGIGSTSASPTLSPTQITTSNSGASIASGWDRVSVGQNFSVGIRNSQIWTWGARVNGSLGDGSAAPGLVPRSRPIQPTQKAQIASPTYSFSSAHASGTSWTRVASAARGFYSLGILDGDLYGWGFSEKKAHGTTNPLGGDNRFIPVPTQITTLGSWTHVAAGFDHSLGIRDGKLYSWGNNAFGLTGLGVRNGTTNTPTQVGTHSDWTSVSAGFSHSLAIRDGKLYVWGEIGPWLGIDTSNLTLHVAEPTLVNNSSNWIGASAGSEYSLGIKP